MKQHLDLPGTMWTETDAMYENDTHLNIWFTWVYLAYQTFAVFIVPLWWPFHF